MLHRRRAGSAARIFLLEGGLDEVHVERHAMLLRAIREQRQGLVGAPVQVGRGQLDLDPLLVVVPGVEVLEESDGIARRELEAREMPGQERTDVRGHALEEALVRLVDEEVLVAQREAVGDAHADVLVGADDRLRPLLDLRQLARRPAVDVLHRGDAGGDHLEGRVEGVEIEVELADDEARGEPELERHVGRAELDGRQADVMVAVHEAGQEHLFAAADDGQLRMAAAQLRKGADRRDDAVLLQHGPVVDLLPAVTVEGARDDVLAANDRG